METLDYLVNQDHSTMFLPYLWGMETGNNEKGCRKSPMFLPYLWGMETTIGSKQGELWNVYVLTVPMRNGNTTWWRKPSVRASVLTVPMRNGNNKHWIQLRRIDISSYRTYEEWKPEDRVFGSKAQKIVLTVPMRNGNCGLLRIEAQKDTVLTVPMRNGNWGRFLEWVVAKGMFLPYLWGMETWN